MQESQHREQIKTLAKLVASEYHTGIPLDNTYIKYIASIKDYLLEGVQDELFRIPSDGGILMTTVDNRLFPMGYSFSTTFRAYDDGVIFRFISRVPQKDRIIECGVMCSVVQSVLRYQEIYKRYNGVTLIEDFSVEYKLGGIPEDTWINLHISHYVGRTLQKAKLVYEINGELKQIVADYPKLNETHHIDMEYFIDWNGLVKEVMICPAGQSGNYIYHIVPTYSSKSQVVLDRNSVTMYRLLNNTTQLVNSSLMRKLKLGGIKSIVPLFYLVQYYNNNKPEQLFELLYIFIQHNYSVIDISVPEQHIFEQIGQLINIEINDQCLLYVMSIKQCLQNQVLLDQLLLMLFSNAFVKQINQQAEQVYCMLLQEYYFTDYKQYLHVFSIQQMAYFLVTQVQQSGIQDEIIRIINFILESSQNELINNFTVLLWIAQFSNDQLKIKCFQIMLRILQNLHLQQQLSTILNVENTKQSIDLLMLIAQTDNLQIITYIVKLLTYLCTSNVQSTTLMNYMIKSFTIRSNEHLHPLINAISGYIMRFDNTMIQNSHGILLLQHIYVKTQDIQVLDELINILTRCVDNINIVYEQCDVLLWILDMAILSREYRLLRLLRILINEQPDRYDVFYIWIKYDTHSNSDIVKQQTIKWIFDEMIEQYTAQQLLTIQQLVIQINVTLGDLNNLAEYLDKVLQYIISSDNDIIEQFIKHHSSQMMILMYNLLNSEINNPSILYWVDLIISLINRLNNDDIRNVIKQSDITILSLLQLIGYVNKHSEYDVVVDKIKEYQSNNLMLIQYLFGQDDSELIQVDTLSISYQFDSDKVRNQFTYQSQSNYQLWIEQHSIKQMQLSHALTILTEQLNQPISTGVGLSIINRWRVARHYWKQLWHHLRLTLYSISQYQIDYPVDQDTTIIKPSEFEYKIMKYITNTGMKPFLKIKFIKQTTFINDPEFNLDIEYLGILFTAPCTQVKSLVIRSGKLTVDHMYLHFHYLHYYEDASHCTLQHHILPSWKQLIKSWKLVDVIGIHRRIFIRNRNSLELHFKDGEQLYLVFEEQSTIIQFIKYFPGVHDFTNSTTNFTHLIHLNQQSCRSYTDFTRYPIFPWVLLGDASDFDSNDYTSVLLPFNYRDLTLPIGAIGSQRRLAEFIKRYEGQGFHYGTHYSSQAIVSQYLVRLPPFTQAAINIQDGKFDLPDRLFRSILKSFVDCKEEMADVRELIPEFYYLPEMFLNLNNLELGKQQSGLVVNNVVLPFYSGKNPFIYVTQNRMALEQVNISGWVDLIWGCKQRGDEAINCHNVFYPVTYSDYQTDEMSEKALETQMAHFGQTPEQLFIKPYEYPQQPNRMQYSQVIQRKKQHQHNQCVILIGCSETRVVCLLANYIIQVYRWQSIAPNGILQNIAPFTCSFEFEKQLPIKLSTQVDVMSSPMVFYKQCTQLIVGGQSDCLLRIYSIDNGKCYELGKQFDIVTSVASNDSICISGSDAGIVLYWQVVQNSLELTHYITDFDAQIECIQISNELTVFLIGSKSGHIGIYNLYNRRLYRIIQHPTGLPIQHLNISDNPLPSILFASYDNILYSYSINGFQLAKYQCGILQQICIIQSKYADTLIVITSNMQCYQYRLPFLDRYVELLQSYQVIQQGRFIMYGTDIDMNEIIFYYHNVQLSVTNDTALIYEKNHQYMGILIDMWRIIINYVNSQDVNSVKYDISSTQNDQHDIWLNFCQNYDYEVSHNYFENSFEYNTAIYYLSPPIITENYMFIYLDNFWPLSRRILYQVTLYIGFIILPWIFINLNIVGYFLLDSKIVPYYRMMQAAFVQLFGNNSDHKLQMCRLMFKIYFVVVTAFICVIIATDFIYLITTLIAKSSFKSTADLKDNGATVCYNPNDVFMTALFKRDRQLIGLVGESDLDCLNQLLNEEADVIIMSEFNLLTLLYSYPEYKQQLRYQVKLNGNKEYQLLINKQQPLWFKQALNVAIEKVRDKHLPNVLYNTSVKSLVSRNATMQYILVIVSISLLLILQLTLLHKELNLKPAYASWQHRRI